MGPNGSGKSYLAALLAGESPLRGGELVFGRDVEGRVAWASFSQQQDQAVGGWLQARWHSLDEDAVSVRAHLSYDSVNEINPFEVRDDDRAARRAFANLGRNVEATFDLVRCWGGGWRSSRTVR
jgi:ABC-type Mn2+/Zn2+ transport system ATPase subunit